MNNKRQIIQVRDATTLAQAAAQRLIARLEANGGRAAVCLTGGAGPQPLYRLLASDTYRSRIPWQHVHWFIGDERFVPSDDPRNNMAVARALFLDACAPPDNIHPIPVQAGTTRDAARRYEIALQTFYGSNRLDPARPLFDLVLMGLGPDGHTASLFPGDAALDERERWVVSVARASVEPQVPRVTLTLPALASCREMLFLVSGENKRDILARVLSGESLPAARVRSRGDTVWLADAAALPEIRDDA
ncbi:MAG: 6-phosphogluconolactonase [Xanthobacteraceae bacterium]|nr:6-phosphogluconolactonase [Xanthobacteraceae bacterium]